MRPVPALSFHAMPDLESRENPYNVTQASRIYFLPNLMTAGNLFCGFVAVIKCIQARLETMAPGTYALSSAELYTQAVWFILVAVIFDSLDGRLARLGGASLSLARNSTPWRMSCPSVSPPR